MPVGSVFEVRDLFYNIPARRKFLRKTSTEFGHVAESVMRLSLAHPHIQFQLIHNDREVFNYYRQQHIFERIAEALGRSVAGALHRIDCERGEVALHGYVAAPEQNRSTTQALYTYINGRFIRDPVVKHAVLDGYRQLLMKGRYPICVLFLQMPPERVDVNVHPTKHEVRFHDQRLIHDFITNAVRQQLRTVTEQTPQHCAWSDGQPVSSSGGVSAEQTAPPVSSVGGTEISAQRDAVQYTEERVAAPLPLSFSDPTCRHSSLSLQGDLENGPGAVGAGVAESSHGWKRAQISKTDSVDLSPDVQAIKVSQSEATSELNIYSEEGYFASLRIIGQYARSYLVCEDGERLILIDQHAAHERIGFERLRAQYACSAVERQELLFPQMLELTQFQDTQMREQVEYFARLGFELEPFGGTTWALKALPLLLEDHDISTLILDILADLSRWGTPRPGMQQWMKC